MNPLRILLAFLYLFAASLIATPEANAFSVENRVGSFLLGTLDYAEQNASQVVELHREKRPVHYDALSGYAVAANRLTPDSAYVTRWDPLNPGRPDPRWSIDTTTFKSGASTANGGIRNNLEFWTQWAKKNPESLSKSNLYRIEELGLSPKIDDAWIKSFPEHRNYLKETLIHHHVDQGAIAIPVPSSTHVGSGGIWHTP